MSEVASYAYFYGDQKDLKKVCNYVDENYSCVSYELKKGKLYLEGLGYLSDSSAAYCALAKAFPQTAFVAYEFYCNVGEFAFMYSAKNSDIYEELCPYSYDDDDDPYYEDDLDDESEEEEEPEAPWHEKIRAAVGAEGLRDLFGFCIYNDAWGAWVFKKVPGFEDEDWESILDE